MKYKAVILDFDGTMIDSIPLWKEVDIDYLGDFSIEVPEDLMTAIEGLGFRDCAQYFKDRFGILDSIEEIMIRWQEMIREKYLNQPIKDDVIDFIKAWDKPMIIASSSDKILIKEVLKKNGVDAFFQGIITSDEVGRSKPHPDVFLKAAEMLGVKPEECVVFEDTLSGVIGAKNAGMRAVAVYYKYNEQWEQTSERADVAIEDFSQWKEVFI